MLRIGPGRPLAQGIVEHARMWFSKHGVPDVETLMASMCRGGRLYGEYRWSVKRSFLDMVSRGELVQRNGAWFVANDVVLVERKK